MEKGHLLKFQSIGSRALLSRAANKILYRSEQNLFQLRVIYWTVTQSKFSALAQPDEYRGFFRDTFSSYSAGSRDRINGMIFRATFVRV